MIMDPSLRGFSSSGNLGILPNPSFDTEPRFDAASDRGNFRYPPSDVTRPISNSSDSPEDCDFSDTVLNYISQILMEEDIEEKIYLPDLKATEKPFYEALGQKYPPSPEPHRRLNNLSRDDDNVSTLAVPSSGVFSRSSNSSSSSVNDGSLDSPSSSVGAFFRGPDFGSESQSVWQFRRGVEEASRFLPDRNDLFLNLERNDPKTSGLAERKGRKNPHNDDVAEEDEWRQRSSKQAAVFDEPTIRSKMFDLVLLCNDGANERHLSSVRETMKDDISRATPKKLGRGKKKEVVDLRTLLIQCAQAVAGDDRRTAAELLSQVRRHASPFGDGNQRLASCFADGLEARLAGTGSQIYKGLVSKRTSAADMLKAYQIYLAACPFRKISHFASNKTIIIESNKAKATRIHVIDFGILYGFQWPTFIQRIALRECGPPARLRITGIEFPQPGFRPAERVEETGRRLKAYAESFKVPFEYNAISKNWETVTLEDLKIEEDEFVAVNCLYRGKNLLEESVAAESPRNLVLDLVKRIDPDLFIHGIVNGSYNAPFFVTRFREALFHFSAIFDMLETIVPPSDPQRILLEKEIFGREALNVIACEGWERVERPETYKQWQIRIMRSGFSLQPFSREVVKRATEKAREKYHRDFVIDEGSGWLLQGWKGRIIFALSLWKPTCK